MQTRTDDRYLQDDVPRCTECGTWLTSPGEHHPMTYCLLVKAGVREPADAIELLRDQGLWREGDARRQRQRKDALT